MTDSNDKSGSDLAHLYQRCYYGGIARAHDLWAEGDFEQAQALINKAAAWASKHFYQPYKSDSIWEKLPEAEQQHYDRASERAFALGVTTLGGMWSQDRWDEAIELCREAHDWLLANDPQTLRTVLDFGELERRT